MQNYFSQRGMIRRMKGSKVNSCKQEGLEDCMDYTLKLSVMEESGRSFELRWLGSSDYLNTFCSKPI